MAPDQIQISASSRGIVDYFFCFVCDEYVLGLWSADPGASSGSQGKERNVFDAGTAPCDDTVH